MRMKINIIIKTLTIPLSRIQTQRYFLTDRTWYYTAVCTYYRKEFLVNFGELGKRCFR